MRRVARNVGLVLNCWRTRTLWACGLALLMILGTAATPDAIPGQIVYVQSKGAEVRAEPNRKAQVIAQLRRGQKVIEFERRSGWVRIGMFDNLGRDGWVHSPLLGPEPPGSRPAPPPPAPTAQAKEPAKEKQKDPALDTFVLDVTGRPGVRIKGRCRVVYESGAIIESGTFRGTVPMQFRINGTAASCTVRNRGGTGLLRVELLVGKRVIAAQEIRAAKRWIRVSGSKAPAPTAQPAEPAPAPTPKQESYCIKIIIEDVVQAYGTACREPDGRWKIKN